MSDEGEYGPKMLALPERQRRFVEVLLDQPNIPRHKAVELAGYQNSNPEGSGHRVTAHRLMHDERVIAALHEHAGRRMRSHSLLAANVLASLLNSEDEKIALKAAGMLLDRVGFGAQQNINIHQTVRDESSKAILQRIEALADRLGVPVAGLLTAKPAAPVVDAEFSEVKDG
jgi:phage terminase small subunit